MMRNWRRKQRRDEQSKQRRSALRTCLLLERLETRELLSTGPLVQVSSLSPWQSTGDVTGQSGTNYLNAGVEPRIAADPSNPHHLVAAWQQDRWSNGGSRGIVSGVSTDGGNTWTIVPIPGTTVNTGGATQRASDPWVSIGPDGIVYANYLVLNDPAVDSTPRGLSASYSTDGGFHWSNPVPVITDTGHQFFNDKNAITADPSIPGTAYSVWDRLYSGNGGPAMFSKTTNGGQTWSAPQVIYDPTSASGAQTLADQIRVLPNGTLVDLSMDIDYSTNINTIEVVRSTDHGATWTSVPVYADQSIGVVDPDNSATGVRSGGLIPDMNVDPANGHLYIVWQDGRFSGFTHDDVAFSDSTDGGLTWSSPTQINLTPVGLPANNAQAFIPCVAVSADGTVAVSYYDFRNNTTATGASTDAWIVFGHPDAQGNVTFGNEQRLTNSSFDYEQAANAGGLFIGDYQGLTAGGQSGYTFGAFFAQAISRASNVPSAMFFRQARGADLETPVATPQSASFNENTTKTITLAGSDVDGDALTYKVTSLPSHGALYDGAGTGGHLITAADVAGSGYTLSGTQVTYSPTVNYHGGDAFNFKANDGTSDSAAAAVSLTVIDNSVPVASPQSVTLNVNTTKTITLSATDADGDPLTYLVTSLPANGVLYAGVGTSGHQITPADIAGSGYTLSGNQVTYAPTLSYQGPDAFNFTASDGTNTGTGVAVSITVTAGPIANPQSVSLNANTTRIVTLTGSDADGDPLTYKVSSIPVHGSLYAGAGTGGHLITASDVVGSGYALSGTQVTYQPTPNYHGGDAFQFKVNDGSSDSGAAAVSITVVDTSVPVPNPQSTSLNENTNKTVTLSATDADGDALTYLVTSLPAHGALYAGAGTGGHLITAGDVAGSGYALPGNQVTYLPTANYHGADAFNFTASDGTNIGTAAAVSLTVIDNSVPVANPQSVSLNENTNKIVTLSAADADSDALTYLVTSLPAHGAIYAGAGTAGHLITAGDIAGGGYALPGNQATYAPVAGYHGPDAFNFDASDSANTSPAVAVSLTVLDAAPPTATPQSVSANETSTRVVTLAGTDDASDALAFKVISVPAHGTLYAGAGTSGHLITGADVAGSGYLLPGNQVTYAPNGIYHGGDSFNFKVNDGTTDSAPATVSVTVADNTVPVPQAQTISVMKNGTRTITLMATDADGDALTYLVTSLPASGALYVGADTTGHKITPSDITGNGYALPGNQVTYAPNHGYGGPDAFKFTASDGTNIAAAATISINVSTHQWTATTVTGSSDGNPRLLWTSTTGQIVLWDITPTGINYSPVYGPFAGWTVQTAAAGPDKLTRILWKHTSGAVSLWLLTADGTAITSQVYGPFAGWSVSAMAIGSDNVTRLLWTNANSAVIWNVNNSLNVISYYVYGPLPGWTAHHMAAGPEGLLRVLWLNTDGRTALWLLNPDGSFFSSHVYAPLAGWTAVGLAVGNDNATRILWSNVSGAIFVSRVTDYFRGSSSPIFGPFPNWTATGIAAETDWSFRVLWNNADGTAALWTLDNDGKFVSAISYGPF